MLRRALALALVFGLAGLAAVTAFGACSDDGTGPDLDVCEFLHISADGRSLWGQCCLSSIQIIGPGVLSSSTTCNDDEGCSASWSATVTRATGTAAITSYNAVYNGSTTCTGP